jgi:hypothetical protein
MGVLLTALYEQKLAEEKARAHITFPTSKYADDIALFAEEILGVVLAQRQAETLEAILRNDRVALKAGRKVGKTRLLAILALWFYCIYDDASVILVAPSERQITEVIWREIVQLFHESGVCLKCRLRDARAARPCPHSSVIDGELSATVRTGLRSGMRRIFGMAPKNSDRARGISGRQLWLLDESSGIDRATFDAADGNRAGGARLVAAGNPTARGSWFHDAFTRLAFERITISALESPNVVLGKTVIPYMADAPWIEEVRAEHGEDSPKYQCDVLGEFPSREQLRLITEVEYAAAVERHASLSDEGPIYFGIDPAGGGVGGDQSVIVARRGAKVLEINPFMGGTDRIVSELDVMLRRYRTYVHEPWHVNFDSAGGYGADLFNALRKLKMTDDYLTFEGLEGRGDARNDLLLRTSGCARPRDAYWLNACNRLKSEVGIPHNEALQQELIFAEWSADSSQGSRLIEKKEYRRRLGRSPDVADALIYALWEGRVLPLSQTVATYEKALREDTGDASRAPMPDYRDPYASREVMVRGGTMDPYRLMQQAMGQYGGSGDGSRSRVRGEE